MTNSLMEVNVSKECNSSSFRVDKLAAYWLGLHSSSLKTETVHLSGKSVNICQIAQHNIPEDKRVYMMLIR